MAGFLFSALFFQHSPDISDMSISYLTAQGLQKLRDELDDLKLNQRPEAIKRIDEAKSMGDISENAEYDEAKDAQAQIERRIFEIEEMLKSYQLIDDAGGDTKKVRVGSTVVVEVNGKEKAFVIVGSNEADPAAGKISNESPIGLALIGAKPGAKVMVKTPAGETMYKIVSIS